MVLEILFGILASIIAMWFSRYREYRADAGSAPVSYTHLDVYKRQIVVT